MINNFIFQVMNPEAPEYNDPSISKANSNRIVDFEPSKVRFKELKKPRGK